ncbi:F-box/LRR-repeat protein 20 [Sparganum proliferum]
MNSHKNSQSASFPGTADKKSNVCINVALPKELILRYYNALPMFESVQEKIAQHSRGFLRYLSLKGCRNINDDTIRRFTELCRLLERLDISECRSLTNETFKYLGENCPELTRLSSTSCSKIDDFGLLRLSSCSHLTRLDVSWCVIGDDGLDAISRGCPGLQHLRVVGCREVTSRGVGYIASRCHGLLLLNLNYCGQGVTDEALIHLAMNCFPLSILSVSHCNITDVGLRALAGTLASSTAAEILGIAMPTTAATNAHNGAAPPPQRTRPASEANAAVVFAFANGGGAGDTGNHRHSAATTPSSPKPEPYKPLVVTGCKNLTVLEVARCFALTDSGLSALSRNCVHLEKLDLEECAQITDATLVQLAIHCPQLNTLVLSHCDLITDEGIAKLAGGRCGPQNLERLTMDNCPLLTDSALDLLGNSCRRLRQLDLYDCQLITKTGIQNLQQSHPLLKIQAYFAPGTPPGSAVGRHRRYCRCCTIF